MKNFPDSASGVALSVITNRLSSSSFRYFSLRSSLILRVDSVDGSTRSPAELHSVLGHMFGQAFGTLWTDWTSARQTRRTASLTLLNAWTWCRRDLSWSRSVLDSALTKAEASLCRPHRIPRRSRDWDRNRDRPHSWQSLQPKWLKRSCRSFTNKIVSSALTQ